LRLIASFLIALAWATSALAQGTLPPEVQAVIDRSKATRVSYAAVLTAEVVRDGQREVGYTAEFQHGSMHRAEVPATRAIGNCDSGDMEIYEVASARVVETNDHSDGMCGIAMNIDPPISGRMLPPVTGDYGRADVIELIGADFLRRYAVTDDGIIVAEAWVPRRPDVHFSLRTMTAIVGRGSQNPAMFEHQSLGRSFAEAILGAQVSRPAH
jgi:hypothetical protein